jgi:hypothetical protein
MSKRHFAPQLLSPRLVPDYIVRKEKNAIARHHDTKQSVSGGRPLLPPPFSGARHFQRPMKGADKEPSQEHLIAKQVCATPIDVPNRTTGAGITATN